MKINRTEILFKYVIIIWDTYFLRFKYIYVYRKYLRLYCKFHVGHYSNKKHKFVYQRAFQVYCTRCCYLPGVPCLVMEACLDK